MSIENAAALLKAIAEFLGVLTWPAVAVFALARFTPELRELFRNFGEFSFKAAGIEASGKRRQVEAAVALGAAAGKDAAIASDSPTESVRRTHAVAEVVTKRVNSRVVRQVAGSRVLWVDDRPANNVFERHSLEALGIEFDLCTSTEDALQRMTQGSYDAVISDMGRPPDDQAGYTLLNAMRAQAVRTPSE